MKKRSRYLLMCIVTIFLVSFISCFPIFAETGSTWIAKAPLNNGRYDNQLAVINDKIYAIGGRTSNGVTSSVEEYDPATNKWTTKAPMLSERVSFQVAVIDNKIYAIGGVNKSGTILNTVEMYDPITNAWTIKKPMANIRQAFRVVVVENKIYAIGGAPYINYLSSVEEYDTTLDQWTTKSSMISPRAYFNVAHVGDKIYVFGNAGGSNSLNNSVEEYNISTDTWSTKSSKPIASYNDKAVTLNGKVYLIGGQKKDTNESLNAVQEYNPSTDTWALKSTMLNARYYHEVAVLGSKIYSISGQNNSSILNSVEEYDTKTDTWVSKSNLSPARWYHQSVVVGNKIYVIGGGDINNSYSNLNSVLEVSIDLQSPQNLIAIPGNLKIDLSWDAVDGASGYNIYRSTTSGTGYIKIGSNTTSSAITYEDKPLTNGTTYYYVVTAIVNGIESGNSNEASATPTTPTEPEPSGNSAMLELTMITGEIKEYDLTAAELQSFLSWYDGRSNGADKAYYMIPKKNNIKPFLSRKEYIAFDKISSFEVKEYIE